MTTTAIVAVCVVLQLLQAVVCALRVRAARERQQRLIDALKASHAELQAALDVLLKARPAIHSLPLRELDRRAGMRVH